MKDRMQLLIGDDGKATLYDDTYDITIHCESEEEQAAVIAKLKSMDWIPVSERLPEESGKYLITALDGVGTRTTAVPYHPQSKSWTLTGRMTYWKVIAWMPLPEPWKEGDTE